MQLNRHAHVVGFGLKEFPADGHAGSMAANASENCFCILRSQGGYGFSAVAGDIVGVRRDLAFAPLGGVPSGEPRWFRLRVSLWPIRCSAIRLQPAE
jgi:hypothetical protein